MNKSPAFQFYPADFLSDENVLLMSNEEVGCYIKLLCFCWIHGSIPTDFLKISKIIFEKNKKTEKIFKKISHCFVMSECGARYINLRLEKERKKQLNHKLNKQNSGKIGAEKRWENADQKYSNAMAVLSTSAIAKNSSSSSSLIKKKDINIKNIFISKKEKSEKMAELEIPDFLQKEDWINFVQHRMEIKKPMSDLAKQKAILKLQQLHNEGEKISDVINQSIVNGWQGLFPAAKQKGFSGANAASSNTGQKSFTQRSNVIDNWFVDRFESAAKSENFESFENATSDVPN